MMTNQERQQLRLIERELVAADPRLAMIMSGGAYRRSVRRATRRRRLALVLVDLLALALIVLAVVTGLLAVIMLSSAVTLLAVTMHVIRFDKV